MNYSEYRFSTNEKILYLAQGLMILGAVSFTFYRSVTAFFLMMPSLFFLYRYKKQKLIMAQKRELLLEFREMILAVQSALNAGSSVENAFIDAGREMEKMYGGQGLIVKEAEVLTRRLRSNENLERILQDMADRSGLEDILDFANVFAAAKRSGGDLSGIIRRASEVIGDKIDIKREIETELSAKQYETRVMELVPFGIILYLNITSPDFLSPLYHNAAGIAIMTVCLALYGTAFRMAEKITAIEV
ncbi:tight adherence protein B [Lachnospiraceae bacterium]|nr:tight adherence protein B [Lachnospiraceae bacterium]